MNNTEVRVTTNEQLNEECCTFDDSLSKEYFDDLERYMAKLPKHRTLDFVKRIFDIVFSLAAIVITSPVMLCTALAVCLDSKGGALFSQERLGLGGKKFKIFKFRSMRLNSEEYGPRWASSDDDRVTRVGKFIRKTRLDELPQLFNILSGNMTFVGPRPERAYFYSVFDKDIPHFKYRLSVIPGLTGWAQVNGGYDLTPAQKINYDIFYIRNRSFWLDIKCIFMTFSVIFTGNGAR